MFTVIRVDGVEQAAIDAVGGQYGRNAEERDPQARNCGRCHLCGRPVREVLDGEEWCDACRTYQRPITHGWSIGSGLLTADRIPCWRREVGDVHTRGAPSAS